MTRSRAVFVVLACLLVSAFARHSPVATPLFVTTADGTQLTVETVATGLRTIWDMNWAPDGEMWITERAGGVSRIDVRTGVVTPVGTVPNVLESGEAGLMGFAFHPDFPEQPWVYFAHSLRVGSALGNRLVRMRYEGGALMDYEVLLDGIRGRGNHNGARLAVGPDRLLYMTMGDAGQRALAQDNTSPNGAILRFTLDGQPAPGNPFDSEVWSWGHRNPQGLAFQPGTGALYSAEHGQNREDEINRIEPGANYGWPMIEGRCDQGAEAEFCNGEFVEPVEVFSPTVGIAGADFYSGSLLPGWDGSLLAVALRGQSLYRITLTPDGRRAAATERLFQGEFGRLRDVLTGPDGVVYIATSNRDGRGSPAPQDDRVLRIKP